MRLHALVVTCFVAASILTINNSQAKTTVSDEQIKQSIIEESISEYPGPCACPFNQARNGSSCGKRSAWSKAGGYSPICYAREVTPEMIKAWRKQNQQ